MDTLKLFMAIPGKVNFLQMGRYGEFSEQTCRNNFENEDFDWFTFNEHLVRMAPNGKFLAIAVDPSFLPKSGKKTPWIGRFWSGVASAIFSKETFVNPLHKEGFHVISRFRNDAVLFYPTHQKPTGKRGHPKWYDGKVDFANLDLSRCEEIEMDKGRLIGLKAYSKSLKRSIKVVVWYPNEEDSTKWQNYFSTDDSMSTKDVIDCYRTRFQLEFCFRDAKHYAGLNDCQSTDLRKLEFHRNASFASINIAKVACKKLGIPFSISSCKSIIHNAYMLNRFICVFGLQPDSQVIDKLFKELVLFTARAA